MAPRLTWARDQQLPLSPAEGQRTEEAAKSATSVARGMGALGATPLTSEELRLKALARQ